MAWIVFLMTENVPLAGEPALGPVGITAKQEELYRLLLRGGALSAAEAARLTGTGAREVRSLMAALEAEGLVSRTAERDPRYLAAAPDSAIEGLIARRRKELDELRPAIESLRNEFHAAATRRDPPELVEVVVGRRAVRHRSRQLLAAATAELLAVHKPPASLIDTPAIDGPDALHGVAVRVIYDRAALGEPGALASIERLAATGRESRLLPETPLAFVVADRALALVPLTPGDPQRDAALVLHPSALLDAILSWFERLWSEALPLRTAGIQTASALSASERTLLILLMGGLKDQAIARQLGMSYRTVQRRVADLMARIGANTRFQAGFLAAHRGLID
ncbi:MAG TPA: LuxR C-terminal-related transcriptional regulator [Actinomycetota bacterium]